jgi:hypothetical protein
MFAGIATSDLHPSCLNPLKFARFHPSSITIIAEQDDLLRVRASACMLSITQPHWICLLRDDQQHTLKLHTLSYDTHHHIHCATLCLVKARHCTRVGTLLRGRCSHSGCFDCCCCCCCAPLACCCCDALLLPALAAVAFCMLTAAALLLLLCFGALSRTTAFTAGAI